MRGVDPKWVVSALLKARFLGLRLPSKDLKGG